MIRCSLNSFRRACTGRRSLASSGNPFDADFLRPRQANYVPLSPVSFLKRSAELFPNRLAGVHGNDPSITFTWDQMSKQASRLASGLVRAFGLQKNDVVSVLAPNTPETYVAHFAMPGSGVILHTINTRLDAATVAYQLQHCSSKVVLVDSEFIQLAKDAIASMASNRHPLPKLVLVHDKGFSRQGPSEVPRDLFALTYEELVSGGDENYDLILPADEWDAISLNYTSGTTGNPKGVVYHHRGAYMNAIGNVLEWHMPRHAKYLWIVPMFHCNGWCFPWTLAAISGTNYFLRQVRAPVIFDLISRHEISYLGGAPILMNLLLDSPDKLRFQHPVRMWAAGSPPPALTIARLQSELNIHVQTAYGMTEVYGPITTFIPTISEDGHDMHSLSALNCPIIQARDTLFDQVQVLDVHTHQPVPCDGKTLGEVCMRGNVVMKGYLRNPSATEECFSHGWLHTGDLAVSYGQGRFELKDRSKDIIISGGENISSTEVENILYQHPDVREVAVVAKPDTKWGEVPVAFVSLAAASSARAALPSAEQLIAWCRDRMPRYTVPKEIVYMDSLPKTATGKIQKNELRKAVSVSSTANERRL